MKPFPRLALKMSIAVAVSPCGANQLRRSSAQRQDYPARRNFRWATVLEVNSGRFTKSRRGALVGTLGELKQLKGQRFVLAPRDRKARSDCVSLSAGQDDRQEISPRAASARKGFGLEDRFLCCRLDDISAWRRLPIFCTP